MTFADECLERANKATPGPWKLDNVILIYANGPESFAIANVYIKEEQEWIDPITGETIRGWGHVYSKREKKSTSMHEANGTFIAHSRTDVVELATRLKKACDKLREAAFQLECEKMVIGQSLSLENIDSGYELEIVKFANELEAITGDK